MADLITKIARDKQEIELSSSSHHGGGTLVSNHTKPSIVIHTQKDVIVQSTVGELDEDNQSQGSRGGDNDERPLKDSTWGNGRNEVAVTASYPPGYHDVCLYSYHFLPPARPPDPLFQPRSSSPYIQWHSTVTRGIYRRDGLGDSLGVHMVIS